MSNEVKECIVVAEDSAPNRKILVHLLEKLGYEVASYDDGQKAWEALENQTHSNVVAVLSDIMMPELDGLELLKKIRGHEKLSSLPVVLITAVSDKEYILQAKTFKVNGYILKPVTFQRVMSKLKEIFPNKNFNKFAS